MTISTSSTSRVGDGRMRSGSTIHLLRVVGCALPHGSGAEDVRAEFVTGDPRRFLDGDAAFSRDTTTVVPTDDGWRLYAEDGSQSKLATGFFDCSVKGFHVHRSISAQLTAKCKLSANRFKLAFH